MSRLACAVALATALATPLGSTMAQSSASDQVSCSATTPEPGSYLRCALWLDGQKVRRGEEGLVIARPGIFRPLRLSSVVAGDSAVHFARVFEKRNATAMLLAIAGGVMIGAASLGNSVESCTGTAICQRHYVWTDRSAALSIGGMTAILISIPFATSAARAAGKAVWWNNARFAR